jgi:DNA-binding SARP family transcriptional activator
VGPVAAQDQVHSGARPPTREIPLGPRAAELLTFLALHPDGVRRETIADTLWADSGTADHVNTAITRLRRTILDTTTEAFRRVIVSTAGRCWLDPDLISVDVSRFRDSIEHSRDLTGQALTTALRAALGHYTGTLADGIDAYWIDTERQAILREALTAAKHLADLITEHNPDSALQVLDQARAINPHNEMTYRQIMRIQKKAQQNRRGAPHLHPHRRGTSPAGPETTTRNNRTSHHINPTEQPHHDKNQNTKHETRPHLELATMLRVRPPPSAT